MSACCPAASAWFGGVGRGNLGGSDWCQGGGSDEFVTFSSDVHACRNFFYDGRGSIILGYLHVPPQYKNWTMSCCILMLPPRHDIGGIWIGLTLAENIGIQSGGGPSIPDRIFSIWHFVGDG